LEAPVTRPRTAQEEFWEGQFGDEYTVRNVTTPEARTPFFRKILDLAAGVRTVCELGANRGDNLRAIHVLRPDVRATAVEVNRSAFEQLETLPGVEAVHASIQDFRSATRYDLVFTCGVLIHLPPEDLPGVYEKMVSLSSRYVLLNEYFNPVPVELEYRGHQGRLFKRDFAGELLKGTPVSLRVVDYGFLWKRLEPGWDNTTWVLMEKVS
jgi:spore coat polysaccharide biosynthesis protein SpsF